MEGTPPRRHKLRRIQTGARRLNFWRRGGGMYLPFSTDIHGHHISELTVILWTNLTGEDLTRIILAAEEMHAVGDFSLVVIWLENLTELQHNIATLEKILIPSLPCYRHRALILTQYYHATAARRVQQLVVQRAFQTAHLPCRLGRAVLYIPVGVWQRRVGFLSMGGSE